MWCMCGKVDVLYLYIPPLLFVEHGIFFESATAIAVPPAPSNHGSYILYQTSAGSAARSAVSAHYQSLARLKSAAPLIFHKNPRPALRSRTMGVPH